MFEVIVHKLCFSSLKSTAHELQAAAAPPAKPNSKCTIQNMQKDLEDRQRRLVRFENVQQLMKQYKKPLLSCAFDLQSRIANQVCRVCMPGVHARCACVYITMHVQRCAHVPACMGCR